MTGTGTTRTPLAQLLAQLLAQGDRRSIGRANEVVKLVAGDSRKVAGLVDCLYDPNPCVCMRAADALEKLSRERADLLAPHKPQLLSLAAETTQREVRWHLALIVARLQLTPFECRQCARILENYLEDRSSLVKTFAMQGLADLTRQDCALRPVVIDLLQRLSRTGTPAMRARGRILLRLLVREEEA